MFALAHPAEDQTKTDRERDGLAGPVRSIRLETVYDFTVAHILRFSRRVLLHTVTYDSNGNKVRVINCDPASGRNKQTQHFKYDDAGRKIQWSVRQGSTRITTIYRYDPKSHKIEALERAVTGKATISRRYVSLFDSNGRQTEARYSENSEREIRAFYSYEFDSAGRVVLVNTYDQNDCLYHKRVYEYDSRGDLISQTNYGPDGTVYERGEFSYSTEGKTERIYKSVAESALKRVLVHRFDNNNNIVDISMYAPDDRLLSRTSHTFDYDDFGNWTRKVSQSWDSNRSEPTATWAEYQLIHYHKPGSQTLVPKTAG
jgi:hypothetical protein